MYVLNSVVALPWVSVGNGLDKFEFQLHAHSGGKTLKCMKGRVGVAAFQPADHKLVWDRIPEIIEQDGKT